MQTQSSHVRLTLSKGRKLVLGFWLSYLVTVIVWLWAWGPIGTTYLKHLLGSHAVTVLIYIPFLPVLVTIVLLVMLLGSVNNTEVQVQLPPDHMLDERQLTEKWKAHQKAYYIMGTLFLTFVAYVAFASIWHLPLPTSPGEGLIVLIPISIMITAIPVCFVAWEQK